jgi:hypothetical protein
MANTYKYFNINPDNDIVGDCVCRAISTATGLNYSSVDELLKITSYLYNCDKLCICCYHLLLEDILKYERCDNSTDYTVGELANKYPRDTILVRIEGHLTSIVKGTILDIWDCSNELVDCYWFVT